MASYRYERNIKEEDLRPLKERHYTRKERWNNWWDYNLKWVVLAVIVVGFVGYCFIGQYFFTVHPDYNIGVVAPYYLPEDTVDALQTQLAAFGEDLNGDGETVVTLNVYTLDYSGDAQSDTDAYMTMAGTTRLAAACTAGAACCIAQECPAIRSIPTSLKLSPKAAVSAVGMSSAWHSAARPWLLSATVKSSQHRPASATFRRLLQRAANHCRVSSSTPFAMLADTLRNGSSTAAKSSHNIALFFTKLRI